MNITPSKKMYGGNTKILGMGNVNLAPISQGSERNKPAFSKNLFKSNRVKGV